MRYRVRIVQDADRELRAVPVFYRRRIANTINDLLGKEPERESRSRIKRLIQPAASVYRLRVGQYRVFYDVEGDRVTILHIRHKDDTEDLYGRRP
jgi:mRNA-degrading endonuclease RelE of RelBE toxin-antitoxin system